MAEKHLNKCSTFLVIREMQISTPCDFISPVRIAKIKTTQVIEDAGKDLEKEEGSSFIGGIAS